MKMLPKSASRPRQLRRFILTAAILPAALASSAFGANWSGPVPVNTSDAPDDIFVLADTIVSLTNGGPTFITENSITFQPSVGNLETLTVNGAGLTLRSLASTLAIASTKTITINGDADFAPGALSTGPVGVPLTGVILQKTTGAGTLILDTPTVAGALAGTTLKVVDGTVSIIGSGGTGDAANPVNSLIPPIELVGNAGGTFTPILRLGSSGAVPTTFNNRITATNNATVEHVSSVTDTISGSSFTIASGKQLTVDVKTGGLIVQGGVNAPSSVAVRGGTLKKMGIDTQLTLSGSVFISNLNVAEGRVDVSGRLRSTTLTLGPGNSTLSVTNQSTATPNNLPATITIPSGATLEGVPGSLVVSAGVQSTLSLTGGTLNLGLGGVMPGLSAHLYSGGDAGANGAFNTFANFSTYFAGRGPGLLTSTGANGYPDLSFAPGFGNTAMYAPIAPTFTVTDNIVSRFNGKILINAPGNYTFATDADDGSMVYINGATVVSNNFYQPHVRRTGTVCLTPGLHDIEIGFYEGGGDNGIIVDYSGPDTGDVPTVIPNAILTPGDALAFANPITVSENSVINANAVTLPSVTISSAAKNLNVNGYKVEIATLALTGGSGAYTVNANTQYGEITAKSVATGASVVSLVSNGAGTLILDNPASPQFTAAGSTVAVTNGALGLVLGGVNPVLGSATFSVNGHGLILSSAGGDQTIALPAFSNGGSIFTRKLASGVAGTPGTPIRTTLTGNFALNPGTSLTLGTLDNYVLAIGGISGAANVTVQSGTVEAGGAVNLTGSGRLNVDKAAFTTPAGVVANSVTVTDGSLTNTGTLTSASTLAVTNSTVTSTGAISATGAMTVTESSLTAGAGIAASSLVITGSQVFNTGPVATGVGGITLTGTDTASVLELNGGPVTGGPITAQGGIIHVKSGLALAATTATFTGLNPTGLRGRFIATGGGGQISRGDTQSGILTIETGTNGLIQAVLDRPLNFPADADGTIPTLFIGANTGPGFAMGFFGNFTAPSSGPYTLQTGLNDDDAGFWVDLDGDGVFEGGNAGGTPGANGNELIAWASCCGDGANQHPGTVTLVGGQTYKVGIAVEDGQGGSGLVGRITAPGESLKIVDPSAVDQTGWWTYGLPNQVLVDVGAELDIQAINGDVDVFVNGHLQFDGAGSSTFDSLTIGPGAIVEIGSGPPAPGAALAVPEPGSLGLAFLGALGLLGRRRGRRG